MIPPRSSAPKQERSGGYVKGNALKGRTFDSLDAQNAFLRHWNRTIARRRIHGTTRRQVWTHFLEVGRPALQPLASGTQMSIGIWGSRPENPACATPTTVYGVSLYRIVLPSTSGLD